MRAPHPGTVSTHLVRSILLGGASRGLDPAALAARFHIAPDLVSDVDARVPLALLLELWEEVPRLAGDDCFGLHLAELLDPAATLTITGYILQSSATLGEGVRSAMRYERLLQDVTPSELVERGDAVMLRHPGAPAGLVVPRHAVEFGFASAVLMTRRATGKDGSPRAVRFEHTAPSDTSEHRRVFGVTATFSAECNEIEFDRALFDLPLVTADAHLRQVLESHARALLADLPSSPTYAARVRQVLCEAIRAGEPSLEHVATRLRTTPRSLQRHLKDEGTTLQRLLDDVRRDLALRYLDDAALGLPEVAYLLGFSDQSAFHRAFVRWKGCAPGRWRRDRRKGAA